MTAHYNEHTEQQRSKYTN